MKTSEQILMALQLCKRNSCSKSCSYHGERACYVKLHSDAAILIRQLEPVRHGRWQFEARGKNGRTETPVCSGCGATPKYYVPKNDVGFQVPPYCHECGSMMDKVVKYENA